MKLFFFLLLWLPIDAKDGEATLRFFSLQIGN